MPRSFLLPIVPWRIDSFCPKRVDNRVNPAETLRVLYGVVVQDRFDFGEQVHGLGVQPGDQLVDAQGIYVSRDQLLKGIFVQGLGDFRIHCAHLTYNRTGSFFGIICILISYTSFVKNDCRCLE